MTLWSVVVAGILFCFLPGGSLASPDDQVIDLLSVSIAKGGRYYSASTFGGDGSFYGTGSHYSAIDFGNGVSVPGSGIFVVKYDSDLSPEQAWSLSDGYSFIRDIYVDSKGNLYYLAFGSPSRERFKLVKRDARFQIVWEIELLGFDVGTTMFTEDGHIITAGQFEKSINVLGQDFSPRGYSDFISLTFSPDGTLVRSRTMGEAKTRMSGGGVAKYGKHLYFLGNASDGLYDGGELLLPKEAMDDFLIKVEESGQVLKARGVYAHEPSYVSLGLSMDQQGNTYLAGRYQDYVSIGNRHFKNRDEVQNCYVAKFDADLDQKWMINLEFEGGWSYSVDAHYDGKGKVIVTGQMKGKLHIGGHDLYQNPEDGAIWFLAVLDSQNGDLLALDKQSEKLAFSMVEPYFDEEGNMVVFGSSAYRTGFGDLVVAKVKPTDSEFGYDLQVENLNVDSQRNVITFDIVVEPAARLVIECLDSGRGGEWSPIKRVNDSQSRVTIEDSLRGDGGTRLYRARVLAEGDL